MGPVGLGGDGNLAALGRELDGIGDEVRRDLLKPDLIGEHLGALLDAGREGDLLGIGRGSRRFDRVGDGMRYAGLAQIGEAFR
jgi:hypothetical protein